WAVGAWGDPRHGGTAGRCWRRGSVPRRTTGCRPDACRGDERAGDEGKSQGLSVHRELRGAEDGSEGAAIVKLSRFPTSRKRYIPRPMPAPRARIGVIFFTVLIDLIGFGIVMPILPFYGQRFGASGLAYGAVLGL